MKRLDGKTENKLTKILYGSFAVTLVFVLLQNITHPWPILFLSGLLALSVTFRHVLVYFQDRLQRLGYLTFLLDILVVFFIGRFDSSDSWQIYYFILIGDAAITCSWIFTGSVAVFCYTGFILEKFLRAGQPPLTGFLPGMASHALGFIAVLAIMSVVRYEITQREKLKRTMFELKLKTKQLEDTYAKLRETSDDLEEMTILKERNRIAREIHDTVGHTLTTVLMELEAGERLVTRDPELAVEKLRLAKGQVRKGLADIRESVGMLGSGREILGLADSMRLLIEETTRHGEVFINSEITGLPQLTGQQEKALYRALQEGLTNGIRHGHSTAFVFKLKYEGGNVRFLLQDNGTGSDRIVRGFGLTAMEQRVKEAGGIFAIRSRYGEGCCIQITIPVDKGGKSNMAGRLDEAGMTVKADEREGEAL